MRVDLERLSFPGIVAAREAAWCVREDGLTLSEVAIESRMSVRDTRELLERLEPELRDAVLSANVDQLIGPLSVGSRYEVAWVVGKAPPDLADPLVRAPAEEAVVEQLVSKAILSHVRIDERPEPRVVRSVERRQPLTAIVWISADERRVPLVMEVAAGFGRCARTSSMIDGDSDSRCRGTALPHGRCWIGCAEGKTCHVDLDLRAPKKLVTAVKTLGRK